MSSVAARGVASAVRGETTATANTVDPEPDPFCDHRCTAPCVGVFCRQCRSIVGDTGHVSHVSHIGHIGHIGGTGDFGDNCIGYRSAGDDRGPDGDSTEAACRQHRTPTADDHRIVFSAHSDDNRTPNSE